MADKNFEAFKRLIESIDTMSSEEFLERHNASKCSNPVGPTLEEFFNDLNLSSQKEFHSSGTVLMSVTYIYNAVNVESSSKDFSFLGANSYNDDDSFGCAA